MSIEEIINVLTNERACVARQGGPGCDRDCGRCDLVLPDKVILQAYDAAIALLHTLPDAQSTTTKPQGNGWISAKERLPGKLTIVWAYKDGQVHVCRRCLVGSWESLTDEDRRRYGRYWTYGPSHWMPFAVPEPPKED